MTMKRERALLEHLGEDYNIDDIQVTSHDETWFEVKGGKYPNEYQVLTEDEANELWEEALESYLEECIYPELPENMKSYFDDDAWKRDARFDGRAHSIARYDGEEHEIGEFVIIRQN